MIWMCYLINLKVRNRRKNATMKNLQSYEFSAGQNPIANPTPRDVVDASYAAGETGSTQDTIFADAVKAMMPTLVVDKYNLALVKDVPGQVDSVTFPVLTNFDLTWVDLSGPGSDTGSDITMTAGPATSFKKLTPIMYGAGMFITDQIDLLTNKHDFKTFAERAAVASAKKMDQDFLSTLSSEPTLLSNVYVAGGMVGSLGSISAGSTLAPSDLSEAKAILSIGSNPYVPDTCVMHPRTYNTFVQSSELRADTYRVTSKADIVSGEVIRYDSLDLVVTELAPAGTGGYYDVAGHPAVVYNRKIGMALAKKSVGFKTTIVDDRIKHGKYILLDIMYDIKVLVAASIIIIRSAD